MPSRIRPIYIDGPLEGEDFPADQYASCVQAIDYGPLREFSLSLTADIVTYQLRQFAFHSGGVAVSFWVGWCSPAKEPDAALVFRALCKPELFERAETFDMPPQVRSAKRGESGQHPRV